MNLYDWFNYFEEKTRASTNYCNSSILKINAHLSFVPVFFVIYQSKVLYEMRFAYKYNIFLRRNSAEFAETCMVLLLDGCLEHVAHVCRKQIFLEG